MRIYIKSIVYCFFILMITTNVWAKNSPNTKEHIDAELLPAFERLQPMDFEKTGVDEYKRIFNNLKGSVSLPKDDEVKVYDVNIDNPDSDKDLRLRIYQPKKVQNSLAGILWIHGGGYLFGVPEQDEGQSIRFAKEVGAVVVAVDYRLAPEHKYPAALKDCYTALGWLWENADDLGINKNKIAVAGASAGGGLCAATTLLARDKGEYKIAFQMPLYPMIDDRFVTPASKEDIDLRVWNNVANKYAWNAYIGELMGTDKVSEYMAPARAKNLQGLPPTYSCVGNLDPFRDDTIDYIARLSQAGVPTELHIYPGAYHAFEVIAPETQYAQNTVNEYIAVLKKALNK